MAREDVTFKIGLDAAGIQRGLTSVKASASQWANEMKSRLTGALGFGAVAGGITATIQQMRQLKSAAEDLGVSTDFLQTLQQLSERFGSTSADANDALLKLNILIGEARQGAGAARDKFAALGISLVDSNGAGLTAQQIFQAVAEKYRQTGDSADKAAIAMDFFGKKGAAINSILGLGAAGVDEWIEKMRSLGLIVSQANVNAIAETGRGIKYIAGLFQNLFGFFVRGWAGAARLGAASWVMMVGVLRDIAAGREINWESHRAALEAVAEEASEQNAAQAMAAVEARADLAERKRLEDELAKLKRETLGDEEQLVELRRELKAIADDLAITDDRSIDYKRKEVELQKKQNELAKAEKDIAKKKNDEREKGLQAALDLLDKANRFTAAERALSDAKAERGKFTLEELASGNPRGVRDASVRSDIFTARRVQFFERLAQQAKYRGDIAGFGRFQTQADQLRAGMTNLNSQERNQYAALEEGVRETNNALLGINNALVEQGIVIKQIVNAK